MILANVAERRTVIVPRANMPIVVAAHATNPKTTLTATAIATAVIVNARDLMRMEKGLTRCGVVREKVPVDVVARNAYQSRVNVHHLHSHRRHAPSRNVCVPNVFFLRASVPSDSHVSAPRAYVTSVAPAIVLPVVFP